MSINRICTIYNIFLKIIRTFAQHLETIENTGCGCADSGCTSSYKSHKGSEKLIDYKEAIAYIKDNVKIRDLMERYFVKFEGDMACCPFHNDHSPSMGLKYNRYYCFACGEKGDVIDFVQRWHRVDIKDAVKIIADMYGFIFLDEPVQAKPRPETTEEWQKRTDKELKEKYINIRDMEYDKMCDTYRTARMVADEKSPYRNKGKVLVEYQKAINDMQYAEYWIDRYNAEMDRIKRRHLYEQR